MTIADIIKEIAKGNVSQSIIVCTVTAVDTKARTIDAQPIDDGAPLLAVNLQANQDAEVGLVLFPRIGSYVVVGMLDGYAAGVVLLTEDVESILATVGNMSIEMTEEGIKLNGGDLGGMVKVEDLTTRLNAIEDDINNLKNAMANAPITPQDGGAAFKAGMTSWYGATLRKSQRSDYENERVKQ